MKQNQMYSLGVELGGLCVQEIRYHYGGLFLLNRYLSAIESCDRPPHKTQFRASVTLTCLSGNSAFRYNPQCRLSASCGSTLTNGRTRLQNLVNVIRHPRAECSLPLLARRASRHARTGSYELSRLGNAE